MIKKFLQDKDPDEPMHEYLKRYGAYSKLMTLLCTPSSPEEQKKWKQENGTGFKYHERAKNNPWNR